MLCSLFHTQYFNSGVNQTTNTVKCLFCHIPHQYTCTSIFLMTSPLDQITFKDSSFVLSFSGELIVTTGCLIAPLLCTLEDYYPSIFIFFAF